VAYEPLRALKEFHDAFGQKRFIELDERRRWELLATRQRLIQEEFDEVDAEIHASLTGDHKASLHHLAKELADLLYVVYGTAEVLEIPLERVFEAVHANNMTKLGPDGKPIVREDGKFLKPDTYVPLDVSTIF
jgi:predicted HAD superfamily Cof-like phosphohydrolase